MAITTQINCEAPEWSVGTQEEFLTAALDGYDKYDAQSPFIIKSGENAARFKEFVGYQDWLLAADFEERGYKISDAQRPAVLEARAYQSRPIQDLCLKYSLKYYREEWGGKLQRFGATLCKLSLTGGIIDEGLLDRPPYSPQGEEIKEIASASTRSCNAANFRMVFGGITGQKLGEKVLNKVKCQKYGHEVAPMEFYAGILKSEHFKQRYRKKVDMFDTYGASFSDISKVARVVKAKGGDVYCVAALSSKALAGTGHRVTILNADESSVTCHDPGMTSGGEAIKIPRQEFAERWAGGYNRAFIFVSRDIAQSSS